MRLLDPATCKRSLRATIKEAVCALSSNLFLKEGRCPLCDGKIAIKELALCCQECEEALQRAFVCALPEKLTETRGLEAAVFRVRPTEAGKPYIDTALKSGRKKALRLIASSMADSLPLGTYLEADGVYTLVSWKDKLLVHHVNDLGVILSSVLLCRFFGPVRYLRELARPKSGLNDGIHRKRSSMGCLAPILLKSGDDMIADDDLDRLAELGARKIICIELELL